MSEYHLLIKGIKFLAAEGVYPDLAGLRFFGVFTLAVGILSMVRPQLFWHLRIGRKVPGVPPTKLYLLVLRTGAVLVIALGLLMIFSFNI